ncbi:MAG TPA: tyrosine-type recombinase/integrase [Polyangiaceae bacterium]|nr:tyrosine-type recombinase/integrase [Polyangiaceae bacterium]
MTRRDPNAGLPPFALEYLREVRSSRPVLRGFHAWLRRTGRPILQLEAAEIESFLTPFLAAQKSHARTRCRRDLFRYFDWLHARQLLSFNPRRVWPDFSNGRSLFELPDQALRFTKTLEPTHKPSTISAYRASLRQFHMWLDAQGLSAHALDRTHVAAWLQSLHARKLSAGHRVQVILAVRAYFLWLEEQPDYAGSAADDLFRRGDLPKRPEYLPRPIPADLDRLLQHRLRKSGSTVQLGLLLMRRTGLRLGELRALPYHCANTDQLGNTFLKVPLGKLNSERLVPLDRATIRVLKKLRALGSTGRRGKRRIFLLQAKTGKPIAFADYRLALKKACRGLVFAEPMTSHRLRHTYATSMLAAGVSLPVLMKLLGHRHYQMTLRYAAITPETVANEYADAAQAIEQRYNLASKSDTAEPRQALTDFARYVLKHVEDNALDKAQARVLVRRLHRLNAAIQRLFRRHPPRGTR